MAIKDIIRDGLQSSIARRIWDALGGVSTPDAPASRLDSAEPTFRYVTAEPTIRGVMAFATIRDLAAVPTIRERESAPTIRTTTVDWS